ncbi:MAG: phenylacetate--CoA ligase family protein, partial [Gammaproteobacteria bacterium]
MSEFYDSLETRDPLERQQALIEAVNKQVSQAKSNAPAYQTLLADVSPDEITDIEAIAKLPITRKSDLIERQKSNHPFGGYAAIAAPELTHIFASPGPIYEPGCNRHDYWRFARTLYAAGFRPGERIHNCFSYHFTPAGSMLDSGAHALGCSVIPAGVGQSELQVQTIADLSPQGYVGTPSFLKIILDKADEM